MATLTAISLFAGYGGIDLGLKRVIPSLRTVCYVEVEAFAAANLVAKIQAGLLDDAPIWSDIKTFDCEPWAGRVDFIHGGYPCPCFSLAGKQKGEEDSRYLWPWVRRAVSIIRPRYCFFENVEGHIKNGLREVLTDLADLGYRVENNRKEPTWGIFSAEEVGAPHRRKRVFILAYRDGSERGQEFGCRNHSQQWNPTGRGQAASRAGERGGSMGDTQCQPAEARGPDGTLPAQPEGGGGYRDTSGQLGDSEGEDRRSQQQPGGKGGGRPRSPGTGTAMADAGGSGLPERGGFRGDPEQEQPTAERDGHPLADANSGWQRQPEGNESVKRGWSKHGREEFPPGPGLGGAGVLDDIRDLFAKDPERAWRRYQVELANTLKWREIPPDLWPAVEREVHKLADGSSSRLDQLRLSGNGCVPKVVAKAFTTLINRIE